MSQENYINLSSEGTIQRVTLLVGSTNFFLHINTLPRLTRSRRDNQSMRERWFRQSQHARALFTWAKGSAGLFFSYKRSLKFNDSARRVTLQPRTGFLNINGTSRSSWGLPENQDKKAGGGWRWGQIQCFSGAHIDLRPVQTWHIYFTCAESDTNECEQYFPH